MSLLFKLQNIGFALSVGTLSVLAVNVEPAQSQEVNNSTCTMTATKKGTNEFPCYVLPGKYGTQIYKDGQLLMTIKFRDRSGGIGLYMGNNPWGIEVQHTSIGKTAYVNWGGFEDKYVFTYTF